MGRFDLASWTLQKEPIILFSTPWGSALKEWASASRGTRLRVWTVMGVLVASTDVIGVGNMLAA